MTEWLCRFSEAECFHSVAHKVTSAACQFPLYFPGFLVLLEFPILVSENENVQLLNYKSVRTLKNQDSGSCHD